MDAISITGCWEGTLHSDEGGTALPFSLRQPPRSLTPAGGTQLGVGGETAAAARLLDGATRAIVALLDDTRDPVSGRVAQLIVEARVRGDGLVGWWQRRDSEDGQLLASGTLSAIRTA